MGSQAPPHRIVRRHTRVSPTHPLAPGVTCGDTFAPTIAPLGTLARPRRALRHQSRTFLDPLPNYPPSPPRLRPARRLVPDFNSTTTRNGTNPRPPSRCTSTSTPAATGFTHGDAGCAMTAGPLVGSTPSRQE